MDYDFKAGPEDEVMRRESARAWERYKAPNGDMWQSILPLVRALLALLAALGARSLREALERAANPVRAAIDEDDRKTVVGQIGKALGLAEDASTKAIVDDVRRLAERVHVEMKIADALRGKLDAARAEVARLTAPVDVEAELYNLAADMKSHATVYDWLRPIVERCARLQRELHGCEATASDLAEQLVEARAEIARLKAAPGEAWERLREAALAVVERFEDGSPDEPAEAYEPLFVGLDEALAAVESPAQVAPGEPTARETFARLLPDLAPQDIDALVQPAAIRKLARAVRGEDAAAVESPAPALTEEEARKIERLCDAADAGTPPSALVELPGRIRAVLHASRRDIPAEVRAPEMAVTTGEEERAEEERAALAETRHDAAARMRARLDAMGVPPAEEDDPEILEALRRCRDGEHRKGGEHSGNACADCGVDFGDLDAEERAEDDERMRLATQAIVDATGMDADEAGEVARAVVDALFNDAPASVDPADLSGDGPPCPWCGSEQHDGPTHMRTGKHAPQRVADSPPASVDPRRMSPDSEEWVERAPGLSVHQPRPEPEACNVDHSDDKRPAVLGGECAKCLHRPPLHEATCTKARCDGHGQAPSGGDQ